MNETKNNAALKIVVAILSFALVACFIWVNTLNNEINRLSKAMYNQHQQFMNQIESIHTDVDRQLKEEASLLSGVEVEYGEINLEDHTIDVTMKLVPKLISDDMKISVSIDGRSTDLTRIGSAFTGTIPVDIYNMGELLLMSIETEEFMYPCRLRIRNSRSLIFTKAKQSAMPKTMTSIVRRFIFFFSFITVPP